MTNLIRKHDRRRLVTSDEPSPLFEALMVVLAIVGAAVVIAVAAVSQ
jgi:hypothetical protein